MSHNDSLARIVLLTLLSLVLALLLGFHIYNIRAKNLAVAEILGGAENSVKDDLAMQTIRNLRASAGEEIEEFEKLVLTEDNLVPLIESLEQAGRTLRLATEIVSVDQIGEPKANEPRKVKIVVEGAGSWAGAYSLIKAVENLPQRVMLEETALSKDGSEWKSRIEFSLYLFN